MSSWYQKLFGDTDTFGLHVSLSRDPHPATDDELLLTSWGSLQIWANGSCLTRSVHSDGTQADGVTWYLRPLLRWLTASQIRLLNEEPFAPVVGSNERIATAAAWFDASEEPPVSLLRHEEDDWFLERERWWRHHCLRAAFPGAALPNLHMRRLGHDVELSWDNESRPPVRGDLTYVSPFGVTTVPVDRVARVIAAVLDEVPRAIAQRADVVDDISDVIDAADVWQWLLPADVRDVVLSAPELAAVRERLARESASQGESLVAQHCLATLLLRDAPVATPARLLELISLADAADSPRGRCELFDAVEPSAPPMRQPYEDGYKQALLLREHLGLDGQPLGGLSDWLTRHHIVSDSYELDPNLDSVTIVVPGHLPRVTVNPQGRGVRRWSRDMLLAAGLGHVLLDAPRDNEYAVVDSRRASWPSAARSRAFAAMLLMPESGVREVVRQHGGVEPDTVRALMARFGVGLTAVTWHLHNLREITEGERDELVERLAGH